MCVCVREYVGGCSGEESGGGGGGWWSAFGPRLLQLRDPSESGGGGGKASLFVGVRCRSAPAVA